MKSLKKKGFTLVELIAVLCILAVIMVIVIPKGDKNIENSKKIAIKAEARAIVDVAKTLKMEGKFKGTSAENKDITNIKLEEIYGVLDTDAKKKEYFETIPTRIRYEAPFPGLNLSYYIDLADADLKRINLHTDKETHGGLSPKS